MSTNYQICHILEITSYVIVTFHSFIERFIQAPFIVHFQFEDFEFITKLIKQLLNCEFVKRPVESSLRVFSML